MKIAVVQLGDKAFANNMIGCLHMNSLYCEKHGYDHIAEDSAFEIEPTNQKPYIILRHLYKYDYVMWVDLDACFVNDDIRIEDIIKKDLSKDVYYADDIGSWALNAGVLIWKNSYRGIDLLWKWWDSLPKTLDPKWRLNGGDQTPLINLLQKEEDPFEAWPRKMFNQYPSEFKAGDFLIHLMGYSMYDVKNHMEFLAKKNMGAEWNGRFLEVLGQFLPNVAERNKAQDHTLIDNEDVIKRML
tara:strand:- start:1890 stop:2615 length:726 start_codon:yes stop_codon:yes gene_type:complete